MTATKQGEKAIGLKRQTKSLHVQQNFFVHFFPSLQDHDFRGIRFSYAMFQLWKMQTHEEEFFFLLLNLGSDPNNSDSPTYEILSELE